MTRRAFLGSLLAVPVATQTRRSCELIGCAAPGFLLMAGELTQAGGEGHYAVGAGVYFRFPNGSQAMVRLKELAGQRVEVVLRREETP